MNRVLGEFQQQPGLSARVKALIALAPVGLSWGGIANRWVVYRKQGSSSIASSDFELLGNDSTYDERREAITRMIDRGKK